MELKRVYSNAVRVEKKNNYCRRRGPLCIVLAALPIGQNIETGLAKVRGEPSGAIERVIVEKGPGLWVRLWQGEGRNGGIIPK